MKYHNAHVHSPVVSQQTLIRENVQYRHTGGVSQNNREQGFVPAFMDTETGRIYRSCFQNGCPAPMHMLVGLPGELLVRNSKPDCQLTIKSSVVSGFLRNEAFYTREQAAALLAKTRQIH